MPASYRTLLVATLAAYAIGAAVVVQLYTPAQWPLDMVNHAVGRDFVNVWAAGRLVLEGQVAVLFDPDAYLAALGRLVHPALAPHVWSYPPTTLLIAAPFGLLPYGWALALWTLAGLAAFVAVSRIGLDARPARIVTALLLVAPATFNNIICGQNGFLTAALLAGGFLLLDTRPMAAGLLLGLLSYKPHLGLVVVPALIALGAWRTVAAAALTALALAAASVLAFGLEPWRLFFGLTLHNQAAMLETFHGFFTRMLVSPYSGLRHLGWSHASAMLTQAGLSALTIAAVVLLVRRARNREDVLAIVAAAAFVVSPYTLTYDLPVLALVIARYAERRPHWTRREAYLLGFAWAIPMLTIPLLLTGIPLPALALVLVFTMLCTDIWRRSSESADGGKVLPATRVALEIHGRDMASPGPKF